MTTLALGLALLAADPAEQVKLERQFAEKLTGATLAGSFSIDGKRGPANDRYEIDKVSKLSGSKWEIVARIKYGAIDVKVPVPVEVLWAGETATIQLTDLALPLMSGKFRTRLLIDGDRYAGTWAHDAVGGAMWGKIERTKPGAGKPQEPPAKDAPAEAKPAPKSASAVPPDGG